MKVIIGSSSSNIKKILLNKKFSDNDYKCIIENTKNYPDTFKTWFENKYLYVQRIDSNEGWGHKYMGNIIEIKNDTYNEGWDNKYMGNIIEKKNIDNQMKNKNDIYDELYLNKMDDFCKIMNVIKKDVLTDPKQEFRYFCYRYLNYMKILNLPKIHNDSFYEAVLIEFRCLPHLEFLIINSIYKLGEKWSQTVVCGLNNYEFISNIVKNINRDIKIIKLNYHNVTQLEYSDLLLTTQFWELFIGEKILIYQEDSCIFKNNINDFIEWDYIGAPWPLEYNINNHGVGNGGFSLRSKSAMIECIKYNETKVNSSPTTLRYMIDNKLKRIPEDVFFTSIILPGVFSN